MTDPIRVRFLTLTKGGGSEHIYLDSLRTALSNHGVVPVDSWREADIVSLFEVNIFTIDALREFQIYTLLQILSSDTPLVVSTDDLYFTGKPDLTVHPNLYPINHRVQRRLFQYSDAVIAISEGVRQNLTPHINTEKTHVVRHGVADTYRVNVPSTTDDPFVLHVSLASNRKNPDALLKTARQLDIPFKIAGSGWDTIVPDEPETENVEVLGYVPEEKLIDLYKRAPVFYFPTLHEGFGLPVLEAMAAGCAVVTSDVYAVPEVTGDAAILLNPNAVDRHVEVIRHLVESPDVRRDLAAEAIERSQQFSWEKAGRETIEVYRSVLDEGES